MMSLFHPPRRRAAGLLLAACATLAGCAAPPAEHFYTLSDGPVPARAAVPAASASAASASAAYYIEMLAVSVPPQVSRSQLVVGTGAGRLALLEQERWAGPLAAEIGQALSSGVTAELGAIDVYRTPYPDTLPLYRISTHVQRFESVPGQYALIDAVWSVREVASGKVLTCRSVISEKVEAGYDALVAGHRRALGRVAGALSAAIRGFAGGGPGSC